MVQPQISMICLVRPKPREVRVKEYIEALRSLNSKGIVPPRKLWLISSSLNLAKEGGTVPVNEFSDRSLTKRIQLPLHRRRGQEVKERKWDGKGPKRTRKVRVRVSVAYGQGKGEGKGTERW